MKKYIFVIFLISLLAAIPAKAQFAVGLRDTHYVNVQYTLKCNVNFRFEQSVYAEKLKYQYFRIYIGAKKTFGPLDISASPYFGMTYCNSYNNMGLDIDATVKFLSRVAVQGGFTPHYDSMLGYSSLWLGRLSVGITKQLLITAAVTNRPEYREPETRLRGGFRFTVANLWVQPEISIPTSGHQGRNVRVLASMGYTF